MILKCTAELTPELVLSIKATYEANCTAHVEYLQHLKRTLETRKPEVFLDICPEDELQIRILL